MKKLAILIILIAVMLVFQPEMAFATENYSLESWCGANGGSWVGSECTLTRSVRIMPAQSLTIAAGETLTIGTYATLWNFGTVVNYGTFRNTWTVRNYGTIDNFGSFQNSSIPNSLADINEFNSLNETAGDTALIVNYGVITIFCPGSYSGSLPYGNPLEESCEDTVIEVTIDIKPGSEQNPINCRASNAVIPVAILTDEDFDARTVDYETVLFENASEIHVSKYDELRRHEEDVDDDGDVDLMLHFRMGDTDLPLTCDATVAELIGLTFDGKPIHGEDLVTTVPRR